MEYPKTAELEKVTENRYELIAFITKRALEIDKYHDELVKEKDGIATCLHCAIAEVEQDKISIKK